jgi:UrcA family protein
MTKFAKFAAAAVLVCAPFALTPSVAAAESGVEIKVGDVDTSTAAGAAVIQQRVEAAARRACRHPKATGSNLMDRQCLEAFREEANQQLAARDSAYATYAARAARTTTAR